MVGVGRGESLKKLLLFYIFLENKYINIKPKLYLAPYLTPTPTVFEKKGRKKLTASKQ